MVREDSNLYLTTHNNWNSTFLQVQEYSEAVACTGARALAPLRSDTKVPLRSGLCDVNDIVDDNNQYLRSLYTEYAVWVGHQVPGGHYPSF